MPARRHLHQTIRTFTRCSINEEIDISPPCNVSSTTYIHPTLFPFSRAQSSASRRQDLCSRYADPLLGNPSFWVRLSLTQKFGAQNGRQTFDFLGTPIVPNSHLSHDILNLAQSLIALSSIPHLVYPLPHLIGELAPATEEGC